MYIFKYSFWILFFAAILIQSSLSVKVDTSSNNEVETETKTRQPRQNIFRGNYRFQVPSYLSPDHYAREIYSHDHRGAPDGSFGYEYQTDNGIKRKEESTGYGVNKVTRGFYSYVGPDGRTYTTRYIADRFGYRAYGDHLPTQPDELFDQTRFPQRWPSNEYNPYYPQRPQPIYTNQINRIDTIPKPLAPSPIQSRPIYVADPSTPTYITITPRPIAASTVVTPSHHHLPGAAYVSAHNYANQQYQHQQQQPTYVWTTAKPFTASTIRPLPYY